MAPLGILDFSNPPPSRSSPQQHELARDLVHRLIQHYGYEKTVQEGYKPAALLDATLQYIASPDTFLKFFIFYIYHFVYPEEQNRLKKQKTPGFNLDHAISYLSTDGSLGSKQINDLNKALESFSEYIIENVFLPLRASSITTPQSIPTSARGLESVALLRQNCLKRDNHRCVVSRKFDRETAQTRYADDDGNLLKDEPSDRFQSLEVAHILPRSLTIVSSDGSQLNDSKKAVHRILDMFDPGISDLINGPQIYSPINALSLTLEYHRLFSEFQIFFEHTDTPHRAEPILRDPLFPVTRSLDLSPHNTIDQPSSRLLGVHRAIALIMGLSGAGEYIERILRDLELDVKEDGTTNLDQLVRLRLSGL
ncbi:hypothetical protein N7456_012044 [Penicillium angulare]|uniref:HNH nuclease domain-containing protein n=1 Tax=Penicillium angulare TaxID=116970 RepID=A0A9W9EUU4_9EURO|nr:hypothetical protein N7456_012044 [Penicillium angulare]